MLFSRHRSNSRLHLTLIALLTLFLVACGSDTSNPVEPTLEPIVETPEAGGDTSEPVADTPEPVDETAMISGPLSILGFSIPDEIASVRVDTFKETYPDVDLQITEGSLDVQQFLTAVASGNPPDLIYTNRDALSTYATRNAIMPLNDCISSMDIDMSQYRQAAVDQVTIDGEIYGIPEFFNIIAVIVNNDALAEAGLTIDDVTISDWDQVNTINNELTAFDDDKLSRIGFDPKLPEFLPLWVAANGGAMLSADGRTALLDSPEVVEALEYTVALHEAAGGREQFIGFRDTWDFFGSENQFVANQLGAFPMEQWYVNVLSDSSPDVNISVIPFTDRNGNPLSYATGNTWAIPAGSAHPEVACAFAKTMTSVAAWQAAAQARADQRAADGQAYTGTYTGNNLADDIIFNDIMQPSGNQTFDDAIQTILQVQDNAFAIPANPAGAEFRQAWQDAVVRVLTGEQSAEESLAQAQAEAQEALDEAWDRQ